MQIDPALRMLGLAAKAGKVASGEFMTENSVKTGMAALVIVATDASDNTKKKFRNIDVLGHSIGKEFRASLAVNDEGLAQAIMKKMD